MDPMEKADDNHVSSLCKPVIHSQTYMNQATSSKERNSINIILPQTPQPPVILHRPSKTIMIEPSPIRRPNPPAHHPAEKKRKDPVGKQPVPTFVKGQDDERPVRVEGLVGQQRRQEIPRPFTRYRY